VIGATYTKAMNLKPGDEFEIRLGYKHIHLIQLSESDKQLTPSDDDNDKSTDESAAEE
jgi:hypothetical protein